MTAAPSQLSGNIAFSLVRLSTATLSHCTLSMLDLQNQNAEQSKEHIIIDQ
jgi:hypothetical protein